MHPHRLGLASRAQFPAAVLEVTDQFLFLGVDRDGGLRFGQKRVDPGIDIVQLGIAIGMTAALPGLAVGLQREAERLQHPTDQFLAGCEAALVERPRQMALALADPNQRCLGVAANGRLDQLAQGVEQSRLLVCGSCAPGAGTANPTIPCITAGAQFPQATADRAAGDPGRFGDGLQAAFPCGCHLAGDDQTTISFIEKGHQDVRTLFDGSYINHPNSILIDRSNA
jgi:hypothetical protein